MTDRPYFRPLPLLLIWAINESHSLLIIGFRAYRATIRIIDQIMDTKRTLIETGNIKTTTVRIPYDMRNAKTRLYSLFFPVLVELEYVFPCGNRHRTPDLVKLSSTRCIKNPNGSPIHANHSSIEDSIGTNQKYVETTKRSAMGIAKKIVAKKQPKSECKYPRCLSR